MWTARLVIAVMGAALATAAAKPVLRGPYMAQVVRVLDGDSVEARVTIWLGQDVLTTVRLAGIDTAELHAKCPGARLAALAARSFLMARLGEGPVTLTDIQTDKYGGRVVAHLADARGEDVATALLSAGLARPYAGRRPDWCAQE